MASVLSGTSIYSLLRSQVLAFEPRIPGDGAVAAAADHQHHSNPPHPADAACANVGARGRADCTDVTANGAVAPCNRVVLGSHVGSGDDLPTQLLANSQMLVINRRNAAIAAISDTLAQWTDSPRMWRCDLNQDVAIEIHGWIPARRSYRVSRAGRSTLAAAARQPNLYKEYSSRAVAFGFDLSIFVYVSLPEKHRRESWMNRNTGLFRPLFRNSRCVAG